mgnify:CR=1 FL=1
MQQAITINKLIDHTNLQPDASAVELEQLAKEAQEYKFNSICIRSNWIKQFSPLYRCSATINFPEKVYTCNETNLKQVISSIGNASIETKIQEAKQAITDGALELDPVINLQNIKNHDYKALRAELSAYIELLKSYDKELWLKPIFSCELLDDNNIEFSIDIFSQLVHELNKNNKIKFAYKNSTGFIKAENNFPLRGTSPELIEFIANQLNEYDSQKIIQIKAAGGIKTQAQALAIIEAAQGRLSHIGTSNGISLL